jgi:hypothetical protein
MKQKNQAQPSLFDLLLSQVQETVVKHIENCKHTQEEKTETAWKGYPPEDIRMTWTCLNCGSIRGRC